VVAKRQRSQDGGALNEDWLKVKCHRVHDFVVGGWIPDGDRKFGALLLGEFVDGELRYVGQVGSPCDARVMRAVAREPSPRTTSPFRDAIREPDAKFCEPAIRVGVEFFYSSDEGYLRPARLPTLRRRIGHGTLDLCTRNRRHDLKNGETPEHVQLIAAPELRYTVPRRDFARLSRMDQI
jgi:ATP-dependent DNA ligase